MEQEQEAGFAAVIFIDTLARPALGSTAFIALCTVCHMRWGGADNVCGKRYAKARRVVVAQSTLLLCCRNKPWSAMAMAPATGHCHPVSLLYCMVSSLLELNELTQ